MNQLLQTIAEHAKGNPTGIAVQTKHSLTTYFEFYQLINDLANQLKQQNIKLLALKADNCLGWLVVDLACQKSDICLLPIPSFFSKQLTEFVLETSTADAIVSDTHISELQEVSDLELIDNLHIFKLENLDQNDALIPSHTSKITFTSGSTGTPKGVCLSIEQMLAVAKSVAEVLPSEQIFKHLCILPLAILLENVAGVYTSLLIGARVILLPMTNVGFTGSSQFSPKVLVEILHQYQPNSHILLPQLLASLLQLEDVSFPTSLKFIAVGGGKVAPSQIKNARELGLPVYEGYGLSESASVVCLNTKETQKIATVGQFLPHISAYIAEDGELIIKGKTFLGYLNDPASWDNQDLATGDLVEQDSDGYISISGRKKNLIISSFGRNISPEWIESAFHQIHGINQTIVFGDAQPNCVALITLHPGVNLKQLDIDISVINEQLPDYAQIKAWSILPKSLTHDDGFLTANGRPKRDFITRHFDKEIKTLYQ
ncbi:MAG: hypothetical protein COA74_06380 [Gammaproteobacteria bacterium]|nr:MAG: hypothetical protein COA74_06380 [Gammaproteobacteria bacterium]